MKLVFLKDNIVINIVVCPDEQLKDYETAILATKEVDSIIHVNNDIYVGIGFTYKKDIFTSQDKVETDISESSFIVDKDNIQDVTDELITSE